MVPESQKASPAPGPLELLLELIRRARSSPGVAALQFVAVNDSHLLAPYRQAALWYARSGVVALSGLVEVEANAPYVQWLSRACTHLPTTAAGPVSADGLPAALASEWSQWLPPCGLWIPFGEGDEHAGGLLLARELPWREFDARLFSEWMATWHCALRAVARPGLGGLLLRQVRRFPASLRRRPVIWALAIVALLLLPVRISVLSPGELVPADPLAVRAPLEGVIQAVHVRTNDVVKAGQPLFTYDDASLSSRLAVVTEALRTAETEARQVSQQALYDPKARNALAAAKGNLEEKRLEVEYLQSQLARNKVLAPRGGIAFIDDAADWVGRPVVAGQRVLRLAEPEDKEIEAWLPVSDAIDLPLGAPARLYLSSSPLEPVEGAVRLVSYEAIRRPDATYAYRVRARLTQGSGHRVGLQGTVRFSGGRVPLVYWVLRRPLAAAREYLGI